MKRLFIFVMAMYFCILALGCAHTVEFYPGHYDIECTKHDAGIIVVIDEETLNKTIIMRSPLVGYGHTWHAKPGKWLKEVAETELPQMFRFYKFSKIYEEPQIGKQRLTIVMTVPNYTFYRFHANISVCVTAYCSDKTYLNQKIYTKEGKSQGAKMFWGGAFAMKSAIRTSSLDAYKQIMAAIRHDLVEHLNSTNAKKELRGSHLKY